MRLVSSQKKIVVIVVSVVRAIILRVYDFRDEKILEWKICVCYSDKVQRLFEST